MRNRLLNAAVLVVKITSCFPARPPLGRDRSSALSCEGFWKTPKFFCYRCFLARYGEQAQLSIMKVLETYSVFRLLLSTVHSLFTELRIDRFLCSSGEQGFNDFNMAGSGYIAKKHSWAHCDLVSRHTHFSATPHSGKHAIPLTVCL